MVEERPEPWWATDPNLAEVLRQAQEDFERELEEHAPRADSTEPTGPDPVLNDLWTGSHRRELCEARDDLDRARARYDEAVLAGREAGLSWGQMASLLGVSRQALHRRFTTGPA